MSEAKVLTCPTCGAQLNVSGAEAQVKCSYCGSNVIVPDELREHQSEAPPAEMTQPQVVVMQPAAPLPRSSLAYDNPPRSRGGSGLFGCLFTFGIIGAVLAIVLVSASPDAKVLVSGLLAGTINIGFAHQVASFGGEGTGPGLFQDARHVAVDGKGNVYVSDYSTLRIQRFDASGKFVGMWTIDAKGKHPTKNGPDKLLADRDGAVYALWTGEVLKYDGATGKLLGTISGDVVNSVANLTEDIHDMALLPDGNLLAIAGFGFDDDLVRFDANGKVVSRIQKIVSTPKDDSVFPSSLKLAVDGLGQIFIIDSFPSNTAVYVFNPDGKYVSKFGSKGKQPGQFDAFNDQIGVDGKSRVYVKNWSNLQVFDATGRYIDTISSDQYANSLFDFTLTSDGLYVVGAKNMIYKLALNARQAGAP